MKATAEVVVTNKRGLHARASNKFAGYAAQFQSQITVCRLGQPGEDADADGETVEGDSILELLMLAAAKGSTLRITAEGADADEAVAALSDLVARKFDEDA